MPRGMYDRYGGITVWVNPEEGLCCHVTTTDQLSLDVIDILIEFLNDAKTTILENIEELKAIELENNDIMYYPTGE